MQETKQMIGSKIPNKFANDGASGIVFICLFYFRLNNDLRSKLNISPCTIVFALISLHKSFISIQIDNECLINNEKIHKKKKIKCQIQ